MLGTLKNLTRDTLKRFNLAVVKESNLQKIIEERARARHDIELLSAFADPASAPLFNSFQNSRAQLRQDLFVLSELGFKRDGYFVEFGATDGVGLSNTFLLEKEFGWRGILAEPSRRWHNDLKRNRDCNIETDCVWRESNSTLSFNEADLGEYSTISSYSSSDIHKEVRKQGKTYDVNTITLGDLLDKFHAPKQIDYLSIDTEGSEFEILSAFNFDKYQFKIITCEHNFAPQRDQINSLLTINGYVLKHHGLSKFDDWYVRPGQK